MWGFQLDLADDFDRNWDLPDDDALGRHLHGHRHVPVHDLRTPKRDVSRKKYDWRTRKRDVSQTVCTNRRRLTDTISIGTISERSTGIFRTMTRSGDICTGTGTSLYTICAHEHATFHNMRTPIRSDSLILRSAHQDATYHEYDMYKHICTTCAHQHATFRGHDLPRNDLHGHRVCACTCVRERERERERESPGR